MRWLRRHLAVLGATLRLSGLLAMQYRWDFLLDGVMSVLWAVAAIVPLHVAFEERATIAGWRYGEALLVIGWFTVLDAILKGAISPSLVAVVDQIRNGTLDFVLLKPADAQFLVSTARFRPWRVVSLVAAALIFAYAFHELGQPPTAGEVASALAMLGAGVLALYSVWILVVSVAFRAVRVDNLRFLFEAIFEAARWPASVFKGALSFLFTFVIPLALMTTYPAQALLGTLSWERFLGGCAGALLFAVVSRLAWNRSIARYTSASS